METIKNSFCACTIVNVCVNVCWSTYACEGLHLCAQKQNTKKKHLAYMYVSMWNTSIIKLFFLDAAAAAKKYKPEYSIEPRLVESKPVPSSKPRRFVIKPGGSEPGPDGDGICLPEAMPGDGARRGGVARPNPESVSRPKVRFKQKNNQQQQRTTRNVT